MPSNQILKIWRITSKGPPLLFDPINNYRSTYINESLIFQPFRQTLFSIIEYILPVFKKVYAKFKRFNNIQNILKIFSESIASKSHIFNTYKFAVITFEHDIYTGNYFDTREKSRLIFNERGYLRVFPDIHCRHNPLVVFEDWYVHPELVDMDYINKLISNNINQYVHNSITTKTIRSHNISY